MVSAEVTVLGGARQRVVGCCGTPPALTPEGRFICSSLSPRPHLSDELAPLIHTDVFLTLSPLDAHPASERVSLHYELGCGEGEKPPSIGAAGPGL